MNIYSIAMSKEQPTLSKERHEELLNVLKKRFEKNMGSSIQKHQAGYKHLWKSESLGARILVISASAIFLFITMIQNPYYAARGFQGSFRV